MWPTIDQGYNTKITPNISNITYTNNKEWLNSYDLFLSNQKQNKSPLLIWIHGGAWISGDKKEYYNFAELLNDKGISVVLINYRLSNRSTNNTIKYPTHIIDGLLAFNHIMENLQNVSYNIDNVFLGGHSAGAHIASLMALKTNSYKLDEIVKNKTVNSISKVKGIISLGGIFDLPLLSQQNSNYQKDFIIPAFSENIKSSSNKSSWQDASPQFVTKGEINDIKYNKLPSVLLIDSIQDVLVHQNQSINFQSKLKNIGFNVTLSQGEYGDHYFIPNHLSVINQIASFITLLTNLKPSLFN